MSIEIDDSSLAKPFISPLCLICARSNSQGEMPVTCEAFPDGIPASILSGEDIHTSSVKGDNNLVFKPL